MESDDVRYVDRGRSRGQYASVCLVECPRCGRCSEVTGERVWITREAVHAGAASLVCVNCGFEARSGTASEEGRPANWFGPTLGFASHRRCPTCGTSMPDALSASADARPSSVRVRCPLGQHEVDIELEWVRVLSDEPCDPMFGCRLWLQTPCKGETLWAYNEAHLLDLYAYVSARLRERVGSSMAARLPRWMTAAKNRATVLRCLDRLQARLGQEGVIAELGS